MSKRTSSRGQRVLEGLSGTWAEVWVAVSERDADRGRWNAVVVDLRIKPPPLTAVARGKMSVHMWFKVSPQRWTSKLVQSYSRIVVLPARLPAYFRTVSFAGCDWPVRISFQSIRMDTREISTQNNPSHIAMGCDPIKAWKVSLTWRPSLILRSVLVL